MVIMIVSGRSGSGKSVALHALEDMGFYCVDNLPILLLLDLINILTKHTISSTIAINATDIAVSIDVRNMPTCLEIFEDTINQLRCCFLPQLIFLEANRSTLIRRYSDTRRLHPLSNKNLSLENAINEEINLLKPIRARADLIIDTSEMSVHDLANIIRSGLPNRQERNLVITFESFGFKYGIPLHADYVFDVRFLPNPYWNPKLRCMTGLDYPVITFLDGNIEVQNFIYHTRKYLEQCLPMLENNNRNYLTIAIGCTGGKHRSVYISQKLTEYFNLCGKKVRIYHRTLEK